MCERSLTDDHGGASMPAVPSFVRAEMLPSGFLVRECEGGGSVIIAVDHFDLKVTCQLLFVGPDLVV